MLYCVINGMRATETNFDHLIKISELNMIILTYKVNYVIIILN